MLTDVSALLMTIFLSFQWNENNSCFYKAIANKNVDVLQRTGLTQRCRTFRMLCQSLVA